MFKRFARLFEAAGSAEHQPNRLAAVKSSFPIPDGPRVHLGCGGVRAEGWINVDRVETSATDAVFDFKDIGSHFESGSLGAVMLIHSVSYLRLWEARDFFKMVYSLLKPNGVLILEFPDFLKCCEMALKATREGSLADYIEAVRGVFAFDLGQIEQKQDYTPYHMAWSPFHLSVELAQVGFQDIRVCPPVTHGPRPNRDSRIEAIRL
jgi:hypothetical protein